MGPVGSLYGIRLRGSAESRNQYPVRLGLKFEARANKPRFIFGQLSMVSGSPSQPDLKGDHSCTDKERNLGLGRSNEQPPRDSLPAHFPPIHANLGNGMFKALTDQSVRTDHVASHEGTLLLRLIASSLVLNEDWDRLPERARKDLLLRSDADSLLAGLVENDLLTEFQARQIKSGRSFGLVLGDYRILDRLGAGGMGTVFKAEHVVLRKTVAIKVVAHADVDDASQLRRFSAKMRTVAQLRHPNIVAATDAGKCLEPGANGQTLFYFVMDYVPGTNLEQLVKHGGPLDPAIVCDIGHQIASALAAADRRDLVHRDIKPSNIIYDSGGAAKLLDLG